MNYQAARPHCSMHGQLCSATHACSPSEPWAVDKASLYSSARYSAPLLSKKSVVCGTKLSFNFRSEYSPTKDSANAAQSPTVLELGTNSNNERKRLTPTMKTRNTGSVGPHHEKRTRLCSGSFSWRFLEKAGVKREVRCACMTARLAKTSTLLNKLLMSGPYAMVTKGFLIVSVRTLNMLSCRDARFSSVDIWLNSQWC